MKTIYCAAAILAANFANSQVRDTFLAAPGELLSNHGWTAQIGAPGQTSIVAGSIPYLGIPEEGNKTRIYAGNTEGDNLPTVGLQGTAYYSLIMNVLNTDGLFPSDGLGSFPVGMGATQGVNVNVNAISAEIFVRAGSVASTFQIGIVNNRGGVVTPTYSTENFPVNVPPFLVVKYVWNSSSPANTASLFINPEIGGPEGTPTLVNSTGTSAGPYRVASFVIRNGGTETAGTGNIEFDNINLGGTYEYVNPSFLGIKNNHASTFSISPNPVTNGMLTITSATSLPKKIVICDLQGREALSANIEGNIMDVCTLASGIYSITVTEGESRYIQKLVVK